MSIVRIHCPQHGTTEGSYCPGCEEERVRHKNRFSGIQVLSSKSFVTEHITGKPVEITSNRKKKELLKRNGLVEYDANAKAKNRLGLKPGKDLAWVDPNKN